jgi:hypothetical protein
MNAHQGKRFLRRGLPQGTAERKIVEEYIREAEHQDGPGYWRNNFKSFDELRSDFIL